MRSGLIKIDDIMFILCCLIVESEVKIYLEEVGSKMRPMGRTDGSDNHYRN